MKKVSKALRAVVCDVLILKVSHEKVWLTREELLQGLDDIANALLIIEREVEGEEVNNL